MKEKVGSAESRARNLSSEPSGSQMGQVPAWRAMMQQLRCAYVGKQACQSLMFLQMLCPVRRQQQRCGLGASRVSGN